jgi:hypothetical protein
MVFFPQDAYSSTLPATSRKYQEEPDWSPAPQPLRRPDARDAPDEGRRDGMSHMPMRNDRESLSYAAAIKAVNDAMVNVNGDNSNDNALTALRGLWRVFDAGVGELGAELNDSLSNKAIFEGEDRDWIFETNNMLCNQSNS